MSATFVANLKQSIRNFKDHLLLTSGAWNRTVQQKHLQKQAKVMPRVEGKRLDPRFRGDDNGRKDDNKKLKEVIIEKNSFKQTQLFRTLSPFFRTRIFRILTFPVLHPIGRVLSLLIILALAAGLLYILRDLPSPTNLVSGSNFAVSSQILTAMASYFMKFMVMKIERRLNSKRCRHMSMKPLFRSKIKIFTITGVLMF